MTNGIQKTKDYDQFKHIVGNRQINNRHLSELTLTIMKKNLLHVNPILVNEEMEIIDGQHRLEVARANELDIYYIVLPLGAIEEVVELNAHHKKWEINDYIQSYAIRGNKNYQWLLNFMEEYQIAQTVALTFLFGDQKGTHMSSAVKAGKLEITPKQKEKAASRADIFYEVRQFLNKKGSVPTAIVRAIIKLHDEGVGKKLVNSMKENASAITPKTTIHEAEAQLRDFLS